MPLPRLETVLNAVSSLANTIRAQATTVKAAFEHDPNVIKDYINDELLPAIDTTKANESEVVHLAGSETITGAKTFISNPIVPTPTGSTHASTKGYVDTTVSGVVLGQIPDNSLTQAKMANEMKKDIVGGIVSYDSFSLAVENLGDDIGQVSDGLENRILTSKIADNFTTDDATYVLSAKKGKELKDTLNNMKLTLTSAGGLSLAQFFAALCTQINTLYASSGFPSNGLFVKAIHTGNTLYYGIASGYPESGYYSILLFNAEGTVFYRVIRSTSTYSYRQVTESGATTFTL